MKKFIVAIIAVLVMTTAVVFASPALFDTPYIGNKYRHTFHKRDCPSVYQMWEEHQVPLNSREEAIQAGYRPCGNCRP